MENRETNIMEIEERIVDNSYLELSFSGMCEKEDLENLADTIYGRSKKYNQNNILINTSKVNNKIMNSFTLFDFGNQLSKLFRGNSHSIASYGDDEIFNEFTDNVLVNRGVRFKRSKNISELINWLNE